VISYTLNNTIMDIDIEPGVYVVAVSGGVDSIALLKLLIDKNNNDANNKWRFIVAHFDHGIRSDSAEDRKVVQSMAYQYRLPFVYKEGYLGGGVSEAVARTARYNFLHQVSKASNAKAIITAHHQDDLLETAILNLIRGTGRKGLTSLSSRLGIVRPLLNTPKRDLIQYAKTNNLVWREDSTNADQLYLRNYIRHRILLRFNDQSRNSLLSIISDLQVINRDIDSLLVNQLHLQSVAGTIDRQWFNKLPHNVARETMAVWLRARGESNFDSKTLGRLVVGAKVAKPGRDFSLSKSSSLRVGYKNLALVTPER
jgi:tRNA(Ile)-lysidine synthase